MATTGVDSIFVDTNVLVYANNRESDLCDSSRRRLNELSGSGNPLFISDQVIREYLVIMTRPGFIEKPISNESAIEDAERMKKEFTLIFPDSTSLENLIELLRKYEIKGKIKVDGVVDKSDVIGAIFGQTEGLMGEELDLRDLQKSARIGRIEVDLKANHGNGILTSFEPCFDFRLVIFQKDNGL